MRTNAVVAAAMLAALATAGRAADQPGAASASAPVPASSPAAIVEDVSGAAGDVSAMDYLPAGKEIMLGADARLVIGYLRSCIRETISGGRIVIGFDQSETRDARIVRERVECDGGRMRLTAQQAQKSGAMVFRGILPEPQLVIYGRSPLLTVAHGAAVTIERLDQKAKRIVLDLAAAAGAHGRFVDLAGSHRPLAAGGLYRATAGEASVVFKVDAAAKPGPTPLLGRLVRL